MNKEAKELIDKAIDIPYKDISKYPLKGIFVIQQRKLHDSGYRLMYVIGHSEWDYEKKDFNYYLLSCSSDVLDLDNFFNHSLLQEIHLDINKNGIIHMWSNKNEFRCVHAVSSCCFEITGW